MVNVSLAGNQSIKMATYYPSPSRPNGTYGWYDDHTKAHHTITVPQLSLFIVWVVSLFVYTIRLAFWGAKKPSNTSRRDIENQQDENSEGPRSKNHTSDATENPPKIGIADNAAYKAGTVYEVEKIKGSEEQSRITTSNTPQPPTFEQLLMYTIALGSIMIYFYMCDYRKVMEAGERVYSRDTFLFLIFLIFLLGCVFTIRPTADKLLNRDQTEEWKGWMQLLFVWYHYFTAKEWYNWIRVYIAAYVWMTGFGNFSFFWVRKDFSLWRVLKMLFRLNFFVILVCLTVNNDYMLYYICAMHTYWFLTVYAFMGILNQWNSCRYKMAAKFTAYAIFNAILFEVPGLHEVIFSPLWFIFGFTDGNHAIMHEWTFRSGLDHWICFIGMICAYNYPHFEAFLKYLEADEKDVATRHFKYGVKGALAISMVGMFLIWHQTCLPLPKFTYNSIHPYTSWVPVIVLIVLRNILPVMRRHYIHLFAWLGKITLETYLSQVHVYLQANAKALIVYIPGYPLLNFSLATIIFLAISYTVFHLTPQFSSWLFPKNYREMAKRVACVGIVFSLAGSLAVATKISGLNWIS